MSVNDPLKLNSPFVPTHCLVVYEEKERNEVYIEHHRIKDGITREGKPLTKKELRGLLETCSKDLPKQLTQQYINYNLLYYNGDAISPEVIWKVPSKKRIIYFSKSLELPEGKVTMPNLLFKVKNDTLSIVAYQRWRNNDTVLFQAPFHNVSRNEVCLGNVDRKKEFSTLEELMIHYQALFFKSEFSHSGDINEEWLNNFWKPLINKESKFPYEQLTKLTLTVDDL